MLLEILFSDDKTLTDAPKTRIFQVIINGKNYRVTVEELEDETLNKEAESSVKTIDENSQKVCSGQDSWVIDSGNKIKAPMAGIVVDLFVAVGVEVAKGELVAVLEAMKMENELRAHRSGKINHITVSKGQFVNQGDTIVVFE
ncbi:biotin/lipoyl attachment domain-containing protein [Desulfofarcimen acetoxidans DSM 771]|uniref:Biotin/lipoyl attachment domain-containing protein n=1 Tax=Desulfofarcimen acetoxidans (strain ATCC 49208 / DSM 771 / KCTC 5769 / VKM B-1644 / 5575) TaxID=485916 RepID=C8W6D1_DESAS|nr:acetyl-CoA carboxylase biotin carboxyl carrier protein subunit [Desulfofarcimen acetoxidans]ACV62220.1 biotin/lipoyl attachment domain-containing protein [Desulfofarcimen acetoxidans DSM 771]